MNGNVSPMPDKDVKLTCHNGGGGSGGHDMSALNKRVKKLEKTTGSLKNELTTLRSDMKDEFNSLRIDMKDEFSSLRLDMLKESAKNSAELSSFRTEVAKEFGEVKREIEARGLGFWKTVCISVLVPVILFLLREVLSRAPLG